MQVYRVDTDARRVRRARRRTGWYPTEMSTDDRTSSGRTYLAAISNPSTSSMSAISADGKTLVRHWSYAICSASSSSGAHDRCTCTYTGFVSPPLLRKASITATSSSRGRYTVTSPSAQLAAHAAVSVVMRGSHERRRLRRQCPQPSPVDVHVPGHADLLAGEQRADHVHALAKPLLATVLVGPAIASDVLVRRLARAQRDPEPVRETSRQAWRSPGRRSLGDSAGRAQSRLRTAETSRASRHRATTTRNPTRPASYSTG